MKIFSIVFMLLNIGFAAYGAVAYPANLIWVINLVVGCILAYQYQSGMMD